MWEKASRRRRGVKVDEAESEECGSDLELGVLRRSSSNSDASTSDSELEAVPIRSSRSRPSRLW